MSLLREGSRISCPGCTATTTVIPLLPGDKAVFARLYDKQQTRVSAGQSARLLPTSTPRLAHLRLCRAKIRSDYYLPASIPPFEMSRAPFPLTLFSIVNATSGFSRRRFLFPDLFEGCAHSFLFGLVNLPNFRGGAGGAQRDRIQNDKKKSLDTNVDLSCLHQQAPVEPFTGRLSSRYRLGG